MTSQPPVLRLRNPTRRGGKPMPNSSTRMPAHFAVMKWPNSCTSTHMPKTGMAASKYQLFIPVSFIFDSFYVVGEPSRATARVPTPHPLHSRPYHDYGGLTNGIVFPCVIYTPIRKRYFFRRGALSFSIYRVNACTI